MRLLQLELNGKRFTSFMVPKGALSPHEEEALRLGTSKALLPVSIAEEEGLFRILFSEEETEPFSEWFRKNRGVWEDQGDALLRFAEEAILCVLDAEAHFLPLAFFSLKEELLRIRPKDMRLFLVPVPPRAVGTENLEKGNEEGEAHELEKGNEGENATTLEEMIAESVCESARIQSELCEMIEALGSNLSDVSWNGYRERFLSDVKREQGLLAVRGTIERARRELYLHF